MAIARGWTDDEVRAFVYEYERQPWGTRLQWLAAQGVNRDRLQRWRSAVFDGDLERSLVPRDSSAGSSPAQRRAIAQGRDQQLVEVDALKERVRQLEEVNDVLGKAIGLLHQMNAQGPVSNEMNEQRDSFGQRTSL